jgi:hypothetical protein
LRAWSTLLSRTKTCMQRSLVDQTVDGPHGQGAWAPGRTDMHHSGADGTWRELASTCEVVPADGHRGPD